VPGADRSIFSRFAVAATAVALFVATLVWRFLTFTGFSNDHYAHLALAQQMLFGERPIRDFTDPGWPLTYMLSAAAWWLAGNTMAVEWLLIALALAAAATLTVVTANRLTGTLWAAVLVTVLQLIAYPRTYSYPKLLAYALGAWAMVAMAAHPSRRRIVVMAGVIATAFLLRHDHGLYVGVAAAMCVAFASRADGWRVATGRMALLTAVTTLWLSPWILFVATNGGLVAYFDRAIEYARAEANASNLRSWPRLALVPGTPLLGLQRPNRPLAQVEWRTDLTDVERSDLERRYSLDFVRENDDARWYYALDPSEDNLDALSRDPRVAGTSGLGRVHRPVWRELAASWSPLRVAPALHGAANAEAWLFWLFWGLPVVCGIAAIWRIVCGLERWRGELAVVVGLCAMAAMVNAGFLRDILRARLADAIVPAALLGAWAMALCWRQPWRWRFWQVVAKLVTVAVLIASFAAIRQIGEWPERLEITGIGGGIDGVLTRARRVSSLLRLPHRQDVAPPSRIAARLMPFFAYLDRCTSESERLIVTGEFPDVPVLAGRRFASDGVVLGAWYSSAKHQGRTVEALRARPPLFVAYMDTTAFRSRFPLIEEFVAEGYRGMTDGPVDGGETVPILVHRARVPLATDSETGWPCFRSPN
jgi:hypothetical protein